jgi:hypothetical protein
MIITPFCAKRIDIRQHIGDFIAKPIAIYLACYGLALVNALNNAARNS